MMDVEAMGAIKSPFYLAGIFAKPELFLEAAVQEGGLSYLNLVSLWGMKAYLTMQGFQNRCTLCYIPIKTQQGLIN